MAFKPELPPGLRCMKTDPNLRSYKKWGQGKSKFQWPLCTAATEKKKKKILPKRHSMKPRLSEQLRFLQEVHQFCKLPHSFRPPFFFSLFTSLHWHAYFEINLYLGTSDMISGKMARRKPENLFKKKKQMERVGT